MHYKIMEKSWVKKGGVATSKVMKIFSMMILSLEKSKKINIIYKHKNNVKLFSSRF